jgi:hypothetical protein
MMCRILGAGFFSVFLAFANCSYGATNTTPTPQPNRGPVIPPQQTRPPLPSPSNSGNGLRRIPVPQGPGFSSLPKKSQSAKPAPTPTPSGTAASSQSTPSTSSSSPSNSANRNNGYYPGYNNGYGYYNGYSGYGYPNGTAPYGLGYYPDGTPYLYPLNPSYGYGGYGYGNYGGYGYYQRPYYYPPFAFADGSQLFGPGPILRMMGVDQWSNQNGGNQNFGNQPGAGQGAANGRNNLGDNTQANAAGNNTANNLAANDPDAKKADRPTPGRAATVAWKFIAYGDGYFGKKKYNDALERYRTASRQSASIADAWFRQGFALAALNKYDLAAKAFHHGLEINADWATTDFHLSDIYGSEDEDKKNKIDVMTTMAEGQPTNGDLAFVLGVHLYFDGQTDKAAPFFRKAAQISGNDGDVKGFLAAK